tara:strand:- start:3363 stop:4322 length:960 start_codon:yes stop_codon:yes gene_type:complete
MNIENILITTTEPKSIFLEILFKYFKSKKFYENKKKIILIGNLSLIIKQAIKFKFKKKLNLISDVTEAKKKVINVINIKLNNTDKIFSRDFSKYISNSFDRSLAILKKNKKTVLVNGPINKKEYLKKKHLGITEYLAHRTKSKSSVMLIYNKKISVSPLTTHLPIRKVAGNVTKIKIIKNVKIINSFYIKYLNSKPKIAVLGLNPHCETTDKISEEKREIIPAIKNLKKKGIAINGPFSADTFFIKKNIDKFDVVIGMYHDQVLTPLKTIFNFNAINITIGLPFIRVSPDHGPNLEMYGKNQSDPASIFCAMEFFNKIK